MPEHPTARDGHGRAAAESAHDDGGGDVGEDILADVAIDRSGAEGGEARSPGQVVLHEVGFFHPTSSF